MVKRRHTATRLLLAKICDGRVRLERLPDTKNISARAFVQGKHVRRSLRTSRLTEAKRLATEWWSELLVRNRKGEQIHAPTFTDCAQKFLVSRAKDASGAKPLISKGQYQQLVWKEALLRPHIGHLRIGDIDAQTLLDLRTKRERHRNNRGDAITNSTIKKDFVFIHSVLVFARDRLKVIQLVPPSPPFTGAKSIVRRGRPYLTETEYRQLTTLARKRAEDPDLNPRVRQQRQELYFYILISVGGALRVGEAESVRWCDCEKVMLTTPDGEAIPAVLMRVLGKHSRGGKRENAYVAFGGVWAYDELLLMRRVGSADADPIFRESHRDSMTQLLKAANLYRYTDPSTGETLTRNRKSLRPTAITMRLEKGENISYRDISFWARTSPEMVARYYDQLHPADAAARVMSFRGAKVTDKKSRKKR